MTHKPNRTNLPPAKSADEYEREIADLRARVENLLEDRISVQAGTARSLKDMAEERNTAQAEIAILKLQLQEAEKTISRAATSISDEWSAPAHTIARNYSRKTDIDLYVEEIEKKND